MVRSTRKKRFPTVQFIKLPKDFGTTKALNLGIRAVTADAVLLMSEPFMMQADDVLAMADRLEASREAGALVALVADQPQARALPTPSAPDPETRVARPGETVECASGPLMVRRFLLTSLQKIDERYGDYGCEPELCMQVKRAGKRVMMDEARASRVASDSKASALDIADRQIGTAAYLGKHHGFVTGILAHLKFILGALFSFQFARLRYLVTGQKIDGTQ